MAFRLRGLIVWWMIWCAWLLGGGLAGAHYHQPLLPARSQVNVTEEIRSVMVNSQGTYRRGEFYHKALSVPDASSHYLGVTNRAELGGGVESAWGRVWVSATPEVFGYSAREYGPFGELVRATGPLARLNPIRFSSKFHDEETDLLYYGYRYYNPSTGYWLSRDPIEEAGGLNLYGFVGNDPVNWIDPVGLEMRLVGAYGILTPGPLGYLIGDTVAENLAAGAYNLIPETANLAAVAFDAMGIIADGTAYGVGIGTEVVTGDKYIGGLFEHGTKAFEAYSPLGILAKCARVTAAGKNIYNKIWKYKVFGTAQETGPGHQFRTYREAIAEAKNPDVVAVHLNHGYNRALGLEPNTISPNRRPDVISIYRDKTIKRIEVLSTTDVPAVLRSRNSALDQQIIDAGFTPTPPVVVRPH